MFKVFILFYYSVFYWSKKILFNFFYIFEISNIVGTSSIVFQYTNFIYNSPQLHDTQKNLREYNLPEIGDFLPFEPELDLGAFVHINYWDNPYGVTVRSFSYLIFNNVRGCDEIIKVKICEYFHWRFAKNIDYLCYDFKNFLDFCIDNKRAGKIFSDSSSFRKNIFIPIFDKIGADILELYGVSGGTGFVVMFEYRKMVFIWFDVSKSLPINEKKFFEKFKKRTQVYKKILDD